MLRTGDMPGAAGYLRGQSSHSADCGHKDEEPTVWL